MTETWGKRLLFYALALYAGWVTLEHSKLLSFSAGASAGYKQGYQQGYKEGKQAALRELPFKT